MSTGRYNDLLQRAVAIAQMGGTEMAPEVLKVPLEYYRDQSNTAHEEEHIWHASPLPLAFSCQIAHPNDYMVRSVTGKSILIVRGEDGVARAFENYCRHRGARIAEDCGNRKKFICPYHAWAYDTQGRLERIPGKEGFTGIEQDERGLIPLPCSERHGLIWVQTRPGVAADISAFLGPEMDAELSQWNYGSAVTHSGTSVDVASNWKMVVENFAETYHFAKVHGQSIPGQMLLSNAVTYDNMGLHHRLGFPAKSITNLAGIPTERWDYRDHLTILYWIFPSLVIVNIKDTVYCNLTIPDGFDKTTIHTFALSRIANPTPEQAQELQYVADSSRQAVVAEDGPILNQLSSFVPHSSQSHVLIGRNEPGVQHVVRTISGRIGFALHDL